MNMQYTITMTPKEKENLKKVALETHQLLSEIAESIEDSDERAEMWGKIRNFNKLKEIFTC